MTRDDQIGEFVLRCNVSACNLEISSTGEQAWITVCNHIFCYHCGQTELGNSLPVTCPICSHQLTSPFDILRTELNPPTHFIKMVLMGMNPDDCMDAARSGLLFWETQQDMQLACHQSSAQSARHEAQEVRRQYEEKFAEMSQEIASLREECFRVKEELKRRSTATSCTPQINSKRSEASSVEKYNGGEKKTSYPPPSIPPPRTSASTSSHHQEGKAKIRQFLTKH